jgi:UDP-N-acetylglucosamine 2-epimerase (hydrolysing)
MEQKKIVFLTGTRADFGKLKSLIEITNSDPNYEVFLFVTGMHLQTKYGSTVDEIVKCGYPNIYKFINHASERSMDQNLAKTIQGFSDFVRENIPHLIVIHGDRVEALAGAIVGSLNNILVAHVEGGEVSGTIDELIRHAVSKMSHTHFVSNARAKQRLIQMGELDESIFEIGSPDVDAMVSKNLPSIDVVRSRYEIQFEDYGIVLFHPVTTESEQIRTYSKYLVDALLESDRDYVVIYPNNDLGSSDILKEYERLVGNPQFKIFPSVRFEYFLVLLKYAKCLIGNSSAGIREAPYYGVATVNIGTRQQNRALHQDILNVGYDKKDILSKIKTAFDSNFDPVSLFGEGKSDLLFKEAISSPSFWNISKQKQFKDL